MVGKVVKKPLMRGVDVPLSERVEVAGAAPVLDGAGGPAPGDVPRHLLVRDEPALRHSQGVELRHVGVLVLLRESVAGRPPRPLGGVINSLGPCSCLDVLSGSVWRGRFVVIFLVVVVRAALGVFRQDQDRARFAGYDGVWFGAAALSL